MFTYPVSDGLFPQLDYGNGRRTRGDPETRTQCQPFHWCLSDLGRLPEPRFLYLYNGLIVAVIHTSRAFEKVNGIVGEKHDLHAEAVPM